MSRRRSLTVFLAALAVAATATGWVSALAKVMRHGSPSAGQIAMAAIGTPLLIASSLVLARILYVTRRQAAKGVLDVRNHTGP